MATRMDSSCPADPYKEFELYLEKAHEEIGAVFHRLEARERNAEGIASTAGPPPVPVRRYLGNGGSAGKRRAGLRVTEDYFIGDLEAPVLTRQHHHFHPAERQRHASDASTTGLRRRTSLPGGGLNRNHSPYLNNNNNNNLVNLINVHNNNNNNGAHEGVSGSDAAVLMTLETDVGGHPNDATRSVELRQKSVGIRNPRRQLRRYLTADSALRLQGDGQTDNRTQSFQLWTSGLMSDFNTVIDGELQRLRESNAGQETTADAQTAGANRRPRLSPWARMQLALIDPSTAAASSNELEASKTLPKRASASATTSLVSPIKAPSIEQLSADIDSVQRQILDDLDVLTATLNKSLQHPTRSEKKGGDEEHDVVDGDDVDSHLSSPLLRPQELQAFLRRVEDSIRTSSTTLDRPVTDKKSTSENGEVVEVSGTAVTETVTKPTTPETEEEESGVVDEEAEPEPVLTTFDNAGTQTSPMSLSRSSSFLWVSDCNCSGSLDGSVPAIPPVSSPTASVSGGVCDGSGDRSADGGRGAAVSEAGSSGVSRIVHMDTSATSSLVSLESPGRHDRRTRRRNRRMCTPDSAADAEEEEDEDEDEGSSVSLAHSLDGGVGEGAESGIGTGSPRPKDRRRRPLPPQTDGIVITQTTTTTSAGTTSTATMTTTVIPKSSIDDSSEASETASSTSSSSSSSSTSSSSGTDVKKKRDKVRRRETWERIRRRHSCKRVPSRRNNKDGTGNKAEVVWLRRNEQPQQQQIVSPSPSPPPPPVPPHAIPIPASNPVVVDTASPAAAVEPVLHKPPVVIVQHQSPVRPTRPRPLPLDMSDNNVLSSSSPSSSSSIKQALQSVLVMELSSQSTPYLSVGSGGGKHHHIKPISATSTPTEPYITLEAGLTAARSHSESAFAELEATEACRWLRATGFPQYAQMYEDWQFPLDLKVVERDHPFLDVDSLQALFRRLSTLNRMAKMRNEKAAAGRSRPAGDHGGQSDDEEDQECALSDQWTFQRHSRRWSRIVDLLPPPGPDYHALGEGAIGPATAVGVAERTEGTADAGELALQRAVEEMGGSMVGSERTTSDPIILSSFRRSSSERLRHGAKSLLRRMESLRSRSRRRPTRPEGSPANGNGLVISAPQLVDAASMEDRMKDRNCVDLSPTASPPSADMNLSAFAAAAGGESSPTSPFGTPSPVGSLKTPKSGAGGASSLSRSFFGRRSFRPSTATSSAASGEDQKDEAHSDSECSPSYSPRRRRDANSNETDGKRHLLLTPPVDMFADGNTPTEGTPPSSLSRGRLYLNFNAKSSSSSRTKNGSSSSAGSVLPASPDEEASPSSSFRSGLSRQAYSAETPTPGSDALLGSVNHAELEGGRSPSSSSSATAAAGGAAASASTGERTPVVVRWHSFRRSSSVSSSANSLVAPQPPPTPSCIPIGSLTVGQFAILRKLALLRLTALLERHTSSSKPSWGWDLPKFMRKSKSPDYKDKNIFGVPLSVMVQRTGEALPHPILAALHYLRQSALDQVGLFRKSGVRSRIAKLKEACEAWNCSPCLSEQQQQQQQAVDFDQYQPYDVADMVKQYFRELPEALMTNKLSETFVTIFQVVPTGLRLDALRCAILLLPDEHRETLQSFLAFLTDVAALASVNQMTPSNLAVCLAPSLFHLPATSSSSSSSSPSPASGQRSGVGSGGNGGGSGGTTPSSTSPRRRKTVGVPDQRELSQNKAAHDCLLQMINDFRSIFTVPDEISRQCRCSYLDDGVPVTLEDLHTAEFGDWQAYMNGCMAAMLRETKDKTRGWESMSNDWRVDIAWKKVGDGHALRLWRVSTEVEAPPAELLHRVLRERHLWDTSLVRQRTLVRLDKQSEIFSYSTATEVPPSGRDYILLRSWRSDQPRGTYLVAEMSIDHPEAPSPSGTVPSTRGIVLASRYLIQPCGAGKSRLVHLSRVDIMGRSPEWYNKNYGHLCALHVARLRDSFRQHLVIAQGPESKV